VGTLKKFSVLFYYLLEVICAMKMVVVLYLINLVLAFLIVGYQYNSGNDNTIVMAGFLYSMVFFINLLLGLFSLLDRRSIAKHYFYCMILLVMIALLSKYVLL
jgi:hypothetical protein